ncbi:hypothetical protein PSTT_01012 [Puccinia striiformis]|uniref:G domain-containing protein n=1 Tax=Puccinia striiformis TaxID=27350 RepID=A0A2S4W4V4_9BASI|nr:hypothetical protein PSTT_01012 [Puccinia striiformis]
MLCSRLQSVQSHLADIRTRVLDRNSRILVTGDLNAGKSTFVNALLAVTSLAPTRKARAEDGLKASNAISLLRQGDVSVSFIDSPGLNRDTLSTMDPRVLWAASQEKAYVFVVVNKWGGIRDKVKAERRIRDNFVSLVRPLGRSEPSWYISLTPKKLSQVPNKQNCRRKTTKYPPKSSHLITYNDPCPPSSSFVARFLSSNPLKHILNFHDDAQAKLEKILPRFNQLSANSHLVDETIGQIEENTVSHRNRPTLMSSTSQSMMEYCPSFNMPKSDQELNWREQDNQSKIGDRKFNPQAMFSKTRKFPLSTSNGTHRAGPSGHCASKLGIATMSDLVDFDRLNWFKSTSHPNLSKNILIVLRLALPQAFLAVELSLMLSSKSPKSRVLRALGNGLVLSSRSSLLDFGVYLIMDIPRAIPRNIGKKLERELNSMINTKSTPNAVQESGEEEAGIRWIDYEIERMSKETRKVVRLTGFELLDLEHAIDVQNWLTQYELDVNQVLGDCTSVDMPCSVTS